MKRPWDHEAYTVRIFETMFSYPMQFLLTSILKRDTNLRDDIYISRSACTMTCGESQRCAAPIPVKSTPIIRPRRDEGLRWLGRNTNLEARFVVHVTAGASDRAAAEPGAHSASPLR